MVRSDVRCSLRDALASAVRLTLEAPDGTPMGTAALEVASCYR